jgi:hypothetical protein
MTSVLSTTEFANSTGTSVSATVQQALIDSAERQLNAYLAKFSVTGSGDIFKEASLELSIANLLTYHKMSGGIPNSDSIDSTVEQHQKRAYELLQQYIDSLTTEKAYYVGWSYP